jgi:hypothetical protein
MDTFLNPEVIAGACLAFYFFVRSALTLIDRKNGNGKVAAVKQAAADTEYRRQQTADHKLLLKQINTINNRIEVWDNLIIAGKFGSVWTAKEVVMIMDKVDRILADGPWTANLNRNYERLKEIKYLLDQLHELCSKQEKNK